MQRSKTNKAKVTIPRIREFSSDEYDQEINNLSKYKTPKFIGTDLVQLIKTKNCQFILKK